MTRTASRSADRLAPDACGVPAELSAAFCLLQEKWALSIVYVLMRGPRGFNEMGRGAGAVNSTTLAQRLTRLERAGIVKKTIQSTMPPRTSYELTAAGRDLKPVIDALARWSARHGGACEKRGKGGAAGSTPAKAGAVVRRGGSR
jgi:DNA-binding HxlR family transcriptional regulator